MADVLEKHRLDSYGGRSINYFYDWLRRTGNVDNLGHYQVEVVEEGGMRYGVITAKAPVELPEPVDPEPKAKRRRGA